jgi:hypothetical protein
MSVTSVVGESKKRLLFEQVVMCHFHAAPQPGTMVNSIL